LYLLRSPPSTEATFYWCYGFLLTGLTLVLIGLAIGWIERIRRPAYQAEVPPREVSPTATHTEPTAAARAPSIAAANPAAAPPVTANSKRGS
jgi:hypothetical protein